MNETAASKNVEAESQPSAANDNTPRAVNADTASDNPSNGDGGRKGQLETGMKGPAQAANDNAVHGSSDLTGPAKPATDARSETVGDLASSSVREPGEGVPAEPANDTARRGDASQITAADNSSTSSRIYKMNRGDLSKGDFKEAGEKKPPSPPGRGGGRGGGGDGTGENGGEGGKDGKGGKGGKGGKDGGPQPAPADWVQDPQADKKEQVEKDTQEEKDKQHEEAQQARKAGQEKQNQQAKIDSESFESIVMGNGPGEPRPNVTRRPQPVKSAPNAATKQSPGPK